MHINIFRDGWNGCPLRDNRQYRGPRIWSLCRQGTFWTPCKVFGSTLHLPMSKQKLSQLINEKFDDIEENIISCVFIQYKHIFVFSFNFALLTCTIFLWRCSFFSFNLFLNQYKKCDIFNAFNLFSVSIGCKVLLVEWRQNPLFIAIITSFSVAGPHGPNMLYAPWYLIVTRNTLRTRECKQFFVRFFF